jgi:membrane-associated phospholipid phosphatase
MMTTEQRREKLNWFLFMCGYFAAGYLAINRFNVGRPNPVDLAFGFERDIPLFPVFILGYILVYFSVLFVYIVVNDLEEWRRAVVSMLGATTFAYLVFLLFPIHMALRPEAPVEPGVINALVRGYFFIDPPYNCFPSLHVTYPTLATLVVWRSHPLMRWVFLATTIVVAVSVVLVKQHYIADVVAGFVNGALWYWLTVRYGRPLTARICTDAPAEITPSHASCG